MNAHEISGRSAVVSKPVSPARRSWWRLPDSGEQYLAGAADLADLERRMRQLEHARGCPVFVTFNH